MRLLDLPIGLLINFHVVLLKDGIKRLVNNYSEREEEDHQELLTAKSAKNCRGGREEMHRNRGSFFLCESLAIFAVKSF